MRIRRIIVAVVLGLVGSWGAAAAATPWQGLVEAGYAALAKGRVEEADRVFEGLSPYVEGANENPELLFDDFAAVATAYLSCQEAGRATIWAQRALTGMERLRGPVHIDLVQPLTVLATARMAENKVIAAASLVDRACRVSWQCGKKPDESLATVTGLVAGILRRRGQDAAAQALVDALGGADPKVTPHWEGTAAATEAWGLPPATMRKGAKGTGKPAELKRYERMKKFVATKQKGIDEAAAWFEAHADAKVLAGPESGKEALRTQARERWRQTSTMVANVVAASELLKTAVRTGVVGPEEAARDRAWLDGLLAKAQRTEELFRVIVPR